MTSASTITALNKKERDEFLYDKMVSRCEIHNAIAPTTTRMATPQEIVYNTKLLEEEQRNIELGLREKPKFYEVVRKNVEY